MITRREDEDVAIPRPADGQGGAARSVRGRRMARPFRLGIRAGGFLTAPLMAIATPLLAIPAITDYFGARGWLAIAIGQSIGALAAIITSMNWPLTGPPLIASLPDGERSSVYQRSLGPQLVVLAGTSVLAGGLAAVIAPQAFVLPTVLTAIAFNAQGLTSSWFWAGANLPWVTVRIEGLVRLIATLLAVGAIHLLGPLWWYPALLLCASAATWVIGYRTVHRRFGPAAWPSFRDVLVEVRGQIPGAVSRLTMGLYFSGGVTIVSLAAPAAATVFAAADRVQKTAINGLTAVPQALTPWVAERGDSAQLSRRIRASLLIDGIFACVVAVASWLVWPVVVDFIFSGTIRLDSDVRILSSAVIGLVILERSLAYHWIVPLKAMRPYYWAGSATSLVGAVALAYFAQADGLSGALLALLGIEAVLSLSYLAIGTAALARTTRAASA